MSYIELKSIESAYMKNEKSWIRQKIEVFIDRLFYICSTCIVDIDLWRSLSLYLSIYM